MKASTLFATIVVVGYIGFEIYALQRAGYRTEPAYILNEFVGAERATSRCGDPDADVERDFTRNMGAVKRSAARDYAEKNPGASSGDVDRYIADSVRQRVSEVDASVDTAGCDAPEVRRLVMLYEKRARLNLR